MKSPVEAWAGIYQAVVASNGFGSYGHGTNYNLFVSALKKIKATRAHPDFIVLTGDFLSHNFGATFQANTGILNTDTLVLFIHKTLQFTAEMLQATFPGTSIFPVLGNNDFYCGDYQGPPHRESTSRTSLHSGVRWVLCRPNSLRPAPVSNRQQGCCQKGHCS